MRKRKKAVRRRRRPSRRLRRVAPRAVAAVAAPTPSPAPAPVAPAVQVEQRGLPLAATLSRVARGPGSPRIRLESAMQLLLAAYGAADSDFSSLILTGWARARHDKQSRLTLAWQREQIRLSIEEILAEGIRTGHFRGDLDAGAVSAVIVSAAEGCLLQAATEGGAVTADRLVRSLLTLAAGGPVSGA